MRTKIVYCQAMGDKLKQATTDKAVITISHTNPAHMHQLRVLLNDNPDAANSILPLLPAGSRYVSSQLYTAANGSHHIRIHFEVSE
jgi:hypothetical protein